MNDAGDMAAKDAIRDLVLLYCRAVDRRDLSLLRALYAPGATDDHGGRFSGDIDAYVDWLAIVLPSVEAMSHHVTNHLIAVDGDRAEGEVGVIAYHRIRAADGVVTELVEGLRYLDLYCRDAGRWQFAARTMVVDWERSAPVSDISPMPAAPESDLSYTLLGDALFARGASMMDSMQ
jgi:hypothetical protein